MPEGIWPAIANAGKTVAAQQPLSLGAAGGLAPAVAVPGVQENQAPPPEGSAEMEHGVAAQGGVTGRNAERGSGTVPAEEAEMRAPSEGAQHATEASAARVDAKTPPQGDSNAAYTAAPNSEVLLESERSANAGESGAQPALPSSYAPLVSAHHEEPVDLRAARTERESDSDQQPTEGEKESDTTKHVPLDTLDPEGVNMQAKRAAELEDEAARSLDDVEKQPNLSYDPFNKDAKFDLQLYLQHMLSENEQRGHQLREMGLAFRDLDVSGHGVGAKYHATVGSVLVPFQTIAGMVRQMLHPPVKHILKGVTGCVKPGEMLLVLGRPGAGCTTLLKSLASYRDGFRSIEGTVLYEGMDHKAIDGPLRGEVVYAPEDDVHFATLTVAQTLGFASAARAPSAPYRVTLGSKQNRKEYIELTREMLATILGLRHTYNTKVGNSLIRGVSGGERKRVTIAETLAARARIAMFDNSSRGLDSSTAHEFMTALRVATDVSHSTTLASIYQAGEGLTQLFDKVVVLNHGHMVYFGPVQQANAYFKSIGYLPHDRQTTADFLVSCTDPNGRRLNPEMEGRIPLTPEEQAAAFEQSEMGKANRAEVDAYIAEMQQRMPKPEAKAYIKETRQQRANHEPRRTPYLLSWPMQVRLAIKRRAEIAMGDFGSTMVISLASLFQALIMGSVFFKLPANTSALFSRSGVIFFALLYNAFMSMTEVPNSYMQRPVVIRQKRFAMLRPSADALAQSLLDLPVRAFTLTQFIIVVYFMSGLSYDAGKFFIFYATVHAITFVMVAFFRTVASLTRSEAAATMVAGLVIIDVALYAGYAIPRPSMVVWWRWLSYCNPVSFGFEILMTNEFRGRKMTCQGMIPAGPGYDNLPMANKVCPVAGSQPGEYMIDALKYTSATYGYEWSNASRDGGIIIAFWIFFLITYLLATEIQTDPAASGGVMVFKRGTIKPHELENYEAEQRQYDHQDDTSQGKVGAGDEARLNISGGLDVSEEVFSWRDVNFDIVVKGEPRRLLDHVSGYVAPGKMTALMGESGAGKTTLLNVLAQRADIGVVTGDFFVDGRPLPRSFQADTGYCQQQDVHLAQQTVREALQFSALLRQPRETPKQDRLDYVETVIDVLGMHSFADAIVGEVGEGLNVEQRKRLTIGVELAAKPSLLLFLDEPTSGLDAQAAWSIVKFLKKLAAEGQAILCTIHQPSGELFNQFDRLLLLQKGGKMVYFGDLGPNSTTLISYFEQRSGVKCGENANPAEYILDVIGAGATATTDKDWARLFRESELYAQLSHEVAGFEGRRNQQTSDPAHDSRLHREYAQPVSVQLAVTVWRAFQSYWRNPVYIISKLGLNLFAGCFVGSSFWGQGKKTSFAALQNKLFAMFMALVMATSLSQQLQPMLIMFRELYHTREQPSKMYRWPVFLTSVALVEIPWNIVGGTIYWIPWFFMTQFDHNGTRAGYSWGMYMLFQLYFCSFAQAIATISANAMVASILYSTFFSFVVVFCGVVQPPPQLPYFWRSWMFHLSPFTYIIEGMLGNVIHDKPVQCTPDEFNVVNPPEGQSCAAYMGKFTSLPSTGYYQEGPNGTCLYCRMKHAESYLSSIDMNGDNRFKDIGYLIAYIAFNFLLLYGIYFFTYALRRYSNVRRSKKARKQRAAAIAAAGSDSLGPAPQVEHAGETPAPATAKEASL